MNDISPPRAAAYDLFADGGETGALMRAHDWASTPLGPPDAWPQSLRTLAGLIMAAKEPMFAAWGPDLNLLYNGPYAEILGAKHPRSVGRPFAEVWSDIWPQFSPIVARTMAGEASWFEDLHIPMRRYGYQEDTWFSFSYTPVRDETSHVAGMFCACSETTGKVRSETALRGSEERIRAIIEGAMDHAIYATDPQGLITDWSPGAQAVFGFAPERAIGRPTDIVFTAEDRAAGAPRAELETAAAEGCGNDERWHVREDGSRVFMNGSTRPLRGSDGRITGFLKIARDETERRAVFEALAQSEARARDLATEQTRLAEIIRQTPDFVGVADLQGHPQFVNEAGLRMVGLADLGAARRTTMGDYHAPAEAARLMREVVPAVLEHGFWEGELAFRRFDDGREVPVQGRLFVIRDEAGAVVGMASILSDITERKREESVLRATEARFRDLADNIPTLCWTANPDGWITWYNRRWYEYTGTSPEDQEGWGWESVHHPDYLPKVAERWRAAIATGQPLEMTFPLRGADGVFRPFLTRIVPIRGQDGVVVRWFGTNTDVTALQEAEAALARSEQRFRDIADSIDQMIWSTLPNGDHDYFNRRWYEYTGVPEGSTDGEGWAGMFHPDDQPRAWERWSHCLRTGEPYHIEYRLRRHDGEWRWVLGRALPVRDGEGRITRWYGTCTDIHEQKMVEARLASIMDAVPVGILMAEAPSGRLVESNRYMETLLRRPVRRVEEAPDYASREAYDMEGRRLSETDWPIRRVLSGEPTAEAEVRFRRGDDSLAWLRIQAAPVRDAAGQLVGAVAGVTDLDEIVRAREVLAQSREELERRAEQLAAERDRMWNVSRELMLVAGFDGRIDAANPAWTEQLGWTPEELVGTSFLDLIHPDDLDRTAAEAASLGEGRPTPKFENRYRHKAGGWRWLSWTATPEAGRIFATARDITGEKEQAATLARIEEQLRQAQKMEAVGQLTGGVAHDFNNLLQIVVGNLELLARSLPADAGRQRRSVENAMNGARRAATLTERLLAFSRRQPLDPKPVSVNKLVSGMSELLSRALGETIEMETVLAAGLWRVEVDGNQLENAILNLAVNARDAMPDGGKLTIETANTRLDESYVQQNVEVTPGQYVVICVSDTGVGMDREVAARVFEPFFTTKEVGKGTGLGLSQVYGFVKQSGGHVKIYSEHGEAESRGTTVKIYLPRHHGEALEDEEPGESALPEGGQEETILVVEDDPDVRAYTVEVLSELGYRVLEAAEAHAAVRLLRDGAVRCDLLFTDVVLPGGMNGEQLAAAAHEARPGLKVLFTTGYARNAIVHHGRLDPGVRLITKPFTYADLAARVRDVLDEDAAAPGAPA